MPDLYPAALVALAGLTARVDRLAKARPRDGDKDGILNEGKPKGGARRGASGAGGGVSGSAKAKTPGTPVGPQAVAAAERLGLKTVEGQTFRTFMGDGASGEAFALKNRFLEQGSGFKHSGTRWNATRARSEFDFDHDDGSAVTVIVSNRDVATPARNGKAQPRGKVSQVVMIPRVETADPKAKPKA